jgi:hypothetical protein
MSRVPGITYDEATDSWSGLPDETTVADGYTLLVLDNGNRILSFGGRRQSGEDVHVLDANNKGIQSWYNDEWGDEPELVMGAILRAVGGVK